MRALEQQRDCCDFIGFLRRRLLAEDKTLAGRPSRDSVQRMALTGMSPARSLAVNGDYLGFRFGDTVFQAGDPSRKALREHVRIKPVHHIVERIVERIVRGNAALERQELAQEVKLRSAPLRGFNKSLGSGQGGAQHQKHDLRQRVFHLPGLTWVFKGRKIIDQALLRDCLCHGRLR